MTYLSRLQDSIRREANSDRRLELRAELTGALARYGQLKDAAQELSSLRSANTAYAPAATAWILIAEGLVAHFQSLAPQALNSFRGAHALANSIGRSDISSLAEAWMAASEYVAGKVTVAAKHAVDAVLRSDSTSTSSLSRAHLVIADCLSCAGSDGLASNHYGLARRYASDHGDISMQSVVLFNAAAFGVAGLTIQDCLQTAPPDRVRSVELQLQSIAHLDAGIGLSSLDALVPLMRAEFLIAAKRWSAAVDQYERALVSAERQGQYQWLAKHLSGQAYAMAQCNQRQLAIRKAGEAAERIVDCSDADNRAIAHMRIAQALALTANEQLEGQHRAQATDEFTTHFELQRQIQQELEVILLPLASMQSLKK